jgi:hypothetical protein
MKVSIWRQFSSNHSAHFDIIAKFESAEWANTVADELTNLMIQGFLWSQEDFDSALDVIHKMRYGSGIGYANWLLSFQHAKRTVQLMNNIMLLSDKPGYSNSSVTSEGLSRMLQSMGGEVYLSAETARHDTTFNIRATAPYDVVKALIAEAKPINGYGGLHYLVEGNNNLEARHIEHEDLNIFYHEIYARWNELLQWVYYLKAYRCTQIEVQFVESHFIDKTKRVSEWMPFDDVDQIQALWSPQNKAEHKKPYRYIHSMIATYATHENAKMVAYTIQDILVQVRIWAEKNPDEAKAISRTYWERLSPIEENFRDLYQIEWNHSILEWVWDAKTKNYSDDCVVVIDDNVLIRNKYMSHYGVYPFENLLRKFKPIRTYTPEHDGSHFVFTVFMTFQTNFLAQRILTEFMERDKFILRDWTLRYTDDWRAFAAAGGDDMQNIREAVYHYRDYLPQLEELASAYEDATYTDDEVRIATCQKELSHFIEKYPIEQVFKYRTAWQRAYDMNFTFEDIQLVDKELVLGKIRFEKANTFRGLYALIQWLRQNYDKNAYFEIVHPESSNGV